jgi:hypothetical protein
MPIVLVMHEKPKFSSGGIIGLSNIENPTSQIKVEDFLD